MGPNQIYIVDVDGRNIERRVTNDNLYYDTPNGKKTQLKHWTEYSELQQRELESVSSAVHRYMQMIHRFGDRDDFKTQIRVQRHNAWLSAAFASHFNTHSIKDICSSWSWEATEILTRCWDEADLAKEDLVLCALES